MRLYAAALLCVFVGSTLLLSELRTFRTRPLAARLSPYLPAGDRWESQEFLSIESFRALLRPLAELIGSITARLFGVSEELPRRLRRVHSDLDASEFRVRQVGIAVVATACVVLAGLVLRWDVSIVGMAALVVPLLAFLIVEQRLAFESDAWKARTFQELPVITEQLGMLLGSGYSLSAALVRVAERSSGCVARDLERVTGRISQGMPEVAALREWADVADVDAVHRLVAVLALNKEAGDLGSMVAAEARSVRAEAHRGLLEAIERKNQQVWIPVTIATLVPGVILMLIPFFDALREFGA